MAYPLTAAPLTAKGEEIIRAALRRTASGEFAHYDQALTQVLFESDGEARLEGIEPPPSGHFAYSACIDCDAKISSEIATAEEGYEVHVSMDRRDPDYERYMAHPKWDLAFVQADLLEHQRGCAIWTIEKGQQTLGLASADVWGIAFAQADLRLVARNG